MNTVMAKRTIHTRHHVNGHLAPNARASSNRCGCRNCGQSLVEFSITLTVGLVLLLVTIQLAIIGNAALAVTQLAYATARYASINPGKTQDDLSSYMKQIASPAINENSGGDLTLTLSPSTTPRQFGTSFSVAIVYNMQSKLLIPNPFLGISFPTSLTGVQTTAMSE